ncbi:putative quinol monooxygenase [Sulfitobacter sp.]|uniref:putative quinol monooxygenase n=1 Tax=Sulfitobacter sp. TaxID=1903071 RepID=UPI003003444A
MSGEVTLTGTLTCISEDEAVRVRASLPDHIALTRAEQGCISFDVSPTDNPIVWTVSERFEDAASFEAHQTRTASSDWATQTKGIARAYKIDGM